MNKQLPKFIQDKINEIIETEKIYMAYTSLNEMMFAYPKTLTCTFGGKKKKVNSLPSDVQQVIVNAGNVIVKLTNGKEGVAILGEHDTFDPYVGFVIAYYKAKNGKNYELKKTLEKCVISATRKGHKQAVLKNYDDKKFVKMGGIVSASDLF